MAFVAAVSAPTVFDHPFDGFSVFVQVYRHQCHGVGRAAGEGLDALFLVHSEGSAHERFIVIVFHIEQAAFRVQELTYVAGEIHHGTVFQ